MSKPAREPAITRGLRGRVKYLVAVTRIAIVNCFRNSSKASYSPAILKNRQNRLTFDLEELYNVFYRELEAVSDNAICSLC